MQIKHRFYRLLGMDDYPADVRSSLALIVLAVFFGNVFGIITAGTPLTGFANALGAGDFLYGLMMGLPVIGSVMQLVASLILERTRNRRAMLITAGVVQRGIWLLVAAAPFIVPQENNGLRIFIIIFALTVSNMGGAFVNISFWSLLGDTLPGKIRGQYMATRNRVGTIATLLGGLVVAFFLDKVNTLSGYSVVFLVAALFGLIDIFFYFGAKEPPMNVPEGKHDSLGTVVREAMNNQPYRRVMGFWLLWSIGISIAGPYFGRYALADLRMTQLELFIMDTTIHALVTIFVLRKWGRLSDTYGQKPVLKVGGLLAALTPVLWMFTWPNRYGIIPVMGALGGLGWAAVNLINANMMVTAMPEKNRSTYLALFFIVMQSLGAALPNIVGGWLLSSLRVLVEAWGLGINPNKILFAISAIIRASAILFMLPLLHEPGARTAREMLSGEWRQIKRDVRRMHFELRVFRARMRGRRLRKREIRMLARNRRMGSKK